MKKLAISLLVGASLAIAPSVFALTSMSADSMKAATGQAGVSIAIDNVVIETYTGETAYTDEAGTDPVGGGSVIISDKHVVKTYLAMVNDADYQADFLAATGTVNAYTYDDDADATTPEITLWNHANALTIDVGVCAALSVGLDDVMGTDVPNVGGVVIGLPTLLIHTTADTYSVGVRMAGTANANTGNNFITISKSDSVMAILGGTVEIAPH